MTDQQGWQLFRNGSKCSWCTGWKTKEPSSQRSNGVCNGDGNVTIRQNSDHRSSSGIQVGKKLLHLEDAGQWLAKKAPIWVDQELLRPESSMVRPSKHGELGALDLGLIRRGHMRTLRCRERENLLHRIINGDVGPEFPETKITSGGERDIDMQRASSRSRIDRNLRQLSAYP